jgi:hypothetical protein
MNGRACAGGCPCDWECVCVCARMSAGGWEVRLPAVPAQADVAARRVQPAAAGRRDGLRGRRRGGRCAVAPGAAQADVHTLRGTLLAAQVGLASQSVRVRHSARLCCCSSWAMQCDALFCFSDVISMPAGAALASCLGASFCLSGWLSECLAFLLFASIRRRPASVAASAQSRAVERYPRSLCM